MGARRRETLDLPATPANIKYAARLRAEIQQSIELGTFDYARTFPKSRHAAAHAPQARRRHTVGELATAYLDTARKTGALSPSSIGSYARWYRARIAPKWADAAIDALQTAELRAWIASLVPELSTKSVRSVVGFLSVLLNQATTDGMLATNPLTPIKLKTLLPKRKTRAEREKVDPFNAVEIDAILAASTRPEERAMIQFAFASGVRIGELIALKWPHIGWATNTIHVEDNLVSAEIGTVEKSTKTEGSERDIPILPAARAALEAMRPISQLRGDYVFTHPTHRGRWANEQQYRDRWRIILRTAGVRYRNPYQTRHTFASTLLEAGEPELLVANLLGHTTVEMVRRHYGRYIKKPEGIVLRGDYSAFGGAGGRDGANLGQSNHLNPPSPKKTA